MEGLSSRKIKEGTNCITILNAVADNMVTERSPRWVTDMGSGEDITATRAEEGGIAAEVAVVVAIVITRGGGITDMTSLCSGALYAEKRLLPNCKSTSSSFRLRPKGLKSALMNSRKSLSTLQVVRD